MVIFTYRGVVGKFKGILKLLMLKGLDLGSLQLFDICPRTVTTVFDTRGHNKLLQNPFTSP